MDWRGGGKETCSQSPASLVSVSFESGSGGDPYPSLRSCWYDIDGSFSKDIKAAVNLVEVLSKKMVRRASGAVVKMRNGGEDMVASGTS